MADTTSIKKGMLVKRAQGKSSLGRLNWKERFFVLTKTSLSYWDKFGGESAGGTQKGNIPIEAITAVEEVVPEAFSPARPHCFQVVFQDGVLYVQTPDATDLVDWVAAIRAQIAMNPLLVERHHSSVYDGKWQCCGVGNKADPGCKACFDYSALRLGGQGDRSSSDPGPAKPPRAVDTRGASSRSAGVPASASSSSLPAATSRQSRELPPLPEALPPTPREPFTAQVMYEYKAVEPTDLSIAVGETLTIIEQEGQHWWKAQNARGKVGYVPSNYVKRAGLDSQPWFHGRMSRVEAAALIKLNPEEGRFLVRESESKAGEYSLSVSHDASLRHYHIKREAGKWFINERHMFDSIIELVEYHRLNSGGLVTRLRTPVANPNVPAPTLGHDQWELDITRIRLGKELGSGQFGVVREGVFLDTGVKLAVKTMKPGSMSESQFFEEAQVMKDMVHPNLVQLHGVCTKQKPMCIVTEFMSNGCLLDYLRDHQTLSRDVIHYMSVQIASGMRYLEQKKFIHRDLAARNCLVGDNYVVKVADFGLARFVLDDEYTASEGTKFPIKWAAPEVIQYARFSTKSDVWSFGVVLWELWSYGRTPYPALTNADVVDKVVQGYRMGRPDAAPQQVYQLMLACWHNDPEPRPAFGDIVQSLEENRAEYSEDFMQG